jgi:acetyltransferase-like isoleucine patch superfamily enzyme
MSDPDILGDIRGKYVVIVNSKIGKKTVVWSFVNIYNSEIGENGKIGSYTEIGGSKVGDDCKIEAHVFIPPGTEIGNHVFIGPGVRFGNDKYPTADSIWTADPAGVTVKDHARIGMGSDILPGITIGENAFIAAGALVVKSVPSNSFAIGRPAYRVSKDLFKRLNLY